MGFASMLHSSIQLHLSDDCYRKRRSICARCLCVRASFSVVICNCVVLVTRAQWSRRAQLENGLQALEHNGIGKLNWVIDVSGKSWCLCNVLRMRVCVRRRTYEASGKRAWSKLLSSWCLCRASLLVNLLLMQQWGRNNCNEQLSCICERRQLNGVSYCCIELDIDLIENTTLLSKQLFSSSQLLSMISAVRQ